jgi:hypothetical protein
MITCLQPVSHAVQDDVDAATFPRTLFIALYLWQGVQNLMAASVVWARCAEVFGAASHVFGVLAAAATSGQLAGAVVVQLLSTLQAGAMTSSTVAGPLCLHRSRQTALNAAWGLGKARMHASCVLKHCPRACPALPMHCWVQHADIGTCSHAGAPPHDLGCIHGCCQHTDTALEESGARRRRRF